jgi:hypothetical protein
MPSTPRRAVHGCAQEADARAFLRVATAGRIDAALIRLGETGEGTLREVVLHDRVWPAQLLSPYAALVTRGKAARTILVWRVVRYA